MKTVIGSMLGACLLLALALSSVQAQPTYPYFNLTAVPGGVAIKAIGAGGATQKSVCFSGTGITEAPVTGTVLPTYVNGFSPNTPTDCVGTVKSYDMLACAGTVLAASTAGITNCVAPPTAPTNVQVSNVSPTAQKVSWDDTSVSASNYVVKFCDSTGGACSPNQIPPGGTLGPDETMYMNTGLEPNHNYTYVVCGKNTTGEVCSGPVALTTPINTPPTSPGGLVLNVLSRTEIKASWADSSDNEDNFLLNYCNATANPACDPNVGNSIVLPPNTTMHTITGLMPNTTYKVDVCAQNTAGTGCAGNEQATTEAVPAPTNLVATAISPTKIELSFIDPDPSEGFTFNVYSCTPGGCTLAFHSNVPGSGNPAVTAVISGLNPSTSYDFAVRTVWMTYESDPSNTANATTPAVPAPTNLVATPLNASQIELSFTDPDPSQGYTFNIYSCHPGPGCTLAFHSNVPNNNAPNPAVTAIISGLMANTTYDFAVTTFTNPESAPTGTVSATTFIGGQALVQQTGQVLCYDANDDVVSCGDASAIGEDGQTLAGVPWPSPRFIMNDPRCLGGGATPMFLDTLTELCYLADPCSCGGTADWYTQVALGADTYDGSGTCNTGDGTDPGDWRLAQFFEGVSLLDFQNLGSMSAGNPGLPQELIDLLTTAGTLASCWDQAFWTSTTALAGGPPAAVAPTGYPNAWQPGWESFGPGGPSWTLKSTSAAPLLVKDAAPAP